MLGTYMCIIVIYSFWIDHLIIIQGHSLSHFTFFISISILSDMSIAIPAFYVVVVVCFHLHKIPFPTLCFHSVCDSCFEVGLL